MVQEVNQEANRPTGMTVSIGKAAKILNVSVSTIKRHEGEWGLRTFWDRRGRRYLLQDLEALRLGAPMPPLIAQDLVGVDEVDDRPAVCRFRIYGTGVNKGYLGFFACQEYCELTDWLSHNFGAGTYYLKLLDENNKMTDSNFNIEIEDPRDAESCMKLDAARNVRMFKSLFRSYKRKL